MSWVAIIIIVLIVLLLIVGVLQFNRLRRLNVQVDGAFAGIDILLTKAGRPDPNLGNSQGAADLEQSTLQAVTDARASISQQEPWKKPPPWTTCSPRLSADCSPSPRPTAADRHPGIHRTSAPTPVGRRRTAIRSPVL